MDKAKCLHREVEDWLVRYKQNSVKPATYERLIVSLSLLMKYNIAYKYLEDLSSDDIQDYLNALVNDGYARSTIKKQYNLLSAFITFAVGKGRINIPIHSVIELPSVESVKKEQKRIEAYNRSQQKLLSNFFAKSDDNAKYIVEFMMGTGLRVGEALALKWDDVDWGRKAIHVQRTLLNPANDTLRKVQNAPKSHSSNRIIPISNKMIAIIERQFDMEEDSGGFVFGTNGNPFSYKTLLRYVRYACKQSGIPYYGLHVFRHTFATNCYYNGCDVKILSKLLGHASASITYNIYIHLFDDALEEMRNVLNFS